MSCVKVTALPCMSVCHVIELRKHVLEIIGRRYLACVILVQEPFDNV